MTELQKLSLRKLREMRLDETPLVVRDIKRRRSRFVILDHDSYRRLLEPAPERRRGHDVPLDLDFAGHGLFWDRPEMTNVGFARLLVDPARPDHGWAWSRMLERLPSRTITRTFGLAALRRGVAAASLRPRTRRAWENALEFWTKEARRRLD
jgi:hypothetical protein